MCQQILPLRAIAADADNEALQPLFLFATRKNRDALMPVSLCAVVFQFQLTVFKREFANIAPNDSDQTSPAGKEASGAQRKGGDWPNGTATSAPSQR